MSARLLPASIPSMASWGAMYNVTHATVDQLHETWLDLIGRNVQTILYCLGIKETPQQKKNALAELKLIGSSCAALGIGRKKTRK
jgi:hypothetical protein